MKLVADHTITAAHLVKVLPKIPGFKTLCADLKWTEQAFHVATAQYAQVLRKMVVERLDISARYVVLEQKATRKAADELFKLHTKNKGDN